jgi:dihydroorotate dehydrogenase
MLRTAYTVRSLPLHHAGRLNVRFASTSIPSSSASTTVKSVVYGTAALAGAGLFSVYYLDSRSALHRYVVTPVLRRIVDAETGHRFAVRVLAAGLAPRDPIPDDELLRTEARLPTFYQHA